MKRIFRRVNSLVVALAITTSLFATIPAYASVYLHQDEDALRDSRWTKVENYDAEHGNVYSFTTEGDHRGTDWFTEEFADGTYVVSMDFKTPSYPTGSNQDIIMVDSEVAGSDRTLLYLRHDGYLAIEIKDAGGTRYDWATTYRTDYKQNEWNNYSIVYKKSGTDVDVMQYVNGTALTAADTRIYDNFRFRRVTVYNHASSSGIYLDNITCRKIEASETLSIEKVQPILSGNNVSKLLIKFNEPLVPSTASGIIVNKSGSNSNLVSSSKVLGQCIEAAVSGLAVGDKYSISFSSTPSSIVGRNYGETTSYMHEDYDADYDTTYPGNITNYDAEHGDVYYFAASTSVYDGKRPLFEDEFADGTYVVSMDFKVNAYIQSGSNEQISIVPPTFANSIGLYLKTEGYVGVEVAGSTNTRWDRCYEPNAWNNYSVVFVKNGTNVDVTQYVNGISRKTGSITESAFRILRIMVYPGKNSTGLYLDNITIRKIETSETLSIENVSPILSGSNVSKLLVKFNEPVIPSTVSSVTVNKSGSNTNLVSSYKVVGQCIEATVSGLTADDEYTLSLGGTPQSVAGKNYDGNTYSYLNDVASEIQLYYGSTKLSGFDSSCADKTLKVVASLFNLGDKPTPTMLLSSLYSNSQETATAYANATNGENISTGQGVVIAHDVIVPAEADSNYRLSTFVWDDIDHIRPLLKPKKTH
ncbi:MAG: hypothetical protein K5768_03400 [Firmicutes bacterium]|nr:hypothetical protein [Bacillota bacterium]